MSRAQNPREEGHAAGIRCGKKIARIEAFGAIRRAAEVARKWDACVLGTGCVCYDKAYEVRRAIRAAIGSDKA